MILKRASFMNLIILCTNFDNYSIKRLKQESRQIVLLNPLEKKSELLERIQEEHPLHKSIILNRVSGISYDDSDLILLEKLKRSGYKVLGDISHYKTFRCKWEQYTFYQKYNLETIDTYNVEDLDLSLSPLDHIKPIVPVIAKPKRSNQGRGIVSLKGDQSLSSQLKDPRYVIQPFLEKKAEYRVLISMNSIIGVMKKTSNGDQMILSAKNAQLKYYRNLSEISNTTIKKELESKTNTLLKLINLPFIAIDYLVTRDDKVKILEINTCPGFEYFEKISSQNVAKSLLEDLKII